MKFFKAIQTKYIGPTNSRGSRVKAIDANGNSITINWRSELRVEDNHTQAANDLLYKIALKNNDTPMRIDGMGTSIDGTGYIFSCVRNEVN